jgi:hypothetical protein
VRPTADFDVEAWVVDGIVADRVGVVDVSVAGLGLLLEPPLDSKREGDRFRLRISIRKGEPFEVDSVVRHVTARTGVCGVEIDRADETALRTFSQTVSELLERASFG